MSDLSYVHPPRRKLLSSNLHSTKRVFLDCKGEKEAFFRRFSLAGAFSIAAGAMLCSR